MTIPLALASLDNTLVVTTPSGPATATAVGTLRFEDGPQPGAKPIALVNRYTNPSLETTLTGLVRSPLAATNSAIRTSSGGGYSGSWYVRCSRGSEASAGVGTRSMKAAVIPGEVVYCGVAVRAPAGTTVNVYLERFNVTDTWTAQELIGAVEGSGALPGDAWQYVELEYTVPAGTHFLCHLLSTGSDQFDADAFIIGPADEVSAYVDGSMGPNYRWSYSAGSSVTLRDWWVFGGALQLEEASSNIVPNPRLAVNDSGWTGSGGTSEGRESLAHAWAMSYKRSVTTGSFNVRPINNNPRVVTPDSPITLSAWLFSPTEITIAERPTRRYDHTDLSSVFLSAGGAGITIPAQTWYRFVWTETTPATATHLRDFWIDFTSEPSGTTIYTTEAQGEPMDHASSYLDGSLPNGYSWAGTANASNSSRVAGSLQVPLATLPGALAYWYSEDFGETWAFGHSAGDGAGNWTIGTYGTAQYSGGQLTFATTRALRLGPIMALQAPLSPADQAKLSATTAWDLYMLVGDVGGVSGGRVSDLSVSPELATDYLGAVTGSRMADIGESSELAGEYIGGIVVEQRSGF